MGTEVATKSRTELAQESAYDPFAMAANDLAGSSAIYAKFNGNSGEFSYGSNAEEVEDGEEMAANVFGARRGWICWVDSEVAEEVMVPIAQGAPPAEHTLTDHGPYAKHDDGTEDGWSAQFAIDFRLLGADHDGVEITYKTSTKSAMRPLGDLLKQFGREYKNHPGMVPIVKFGKGSYMPKEKKHGKKYFPTFTIVRWMEEDELLAKYGDGASVSEGEDNDNLIDESTALAEAAAAKAKADADKKAKAAAAAKKKAEAEAKAAAEAEAEAVEEVEVPADEEEDEDERALREMQERIAAKKAAAAAAAAKAAEPEEPAEEAPADDAAGEAAPAGRRVRRRNF